MCLYIYIFQAIVAHAPPCNQTCDGDNQIPTLPFPFGFSSGCPIQLNCTPNGTVLIGEFEVHTVTGDHFIINLPQKCGRSINAVRQLFGRNYAPTSQNGILLQNCSTPITGCVIPTTKVQSPFEMLDCSSNFGNISCYTEPSAQSLFVHYRTLLSTGCSSLFSAISTVELRNSSGVSLDVGLIRMGWWIEGNCQCSENSNCTELVSPIYRQQGFRCQCLEGFVGDGYRDGLGCRTGYYAMCGRKDEKNIKEAKGGWTEKVPLRIVKKPVVIKVISVLVSVSVLLGVLGLTLYAWKKKKQHKFQEEKRRHMEDLDLPLYDMDTIANATNNFASSNKIGEGGFGPVFKGILKEGQEIAVKRLSKNSRQGIEEFKNEVKYISKLNHRNLVKLLGCCIQGEEKMLIYEYMPNKSLDFFIFDNTRNMLLDWHNRFLIIGGIARGLMYLHQDSRLRVVHRDIKAANILLDNELNPKISDFGLARSFGENTTEANTNKIVGTYGYISPEYAVDGLYSMKSDVFSFGVLVLEIVSGQRNRGFHHHDHRLNLLGHAWTLHREGRSLELIDKSRVATSNLPAVLRSVHVGLLCVQQYHGDRPSMSSVVQMLGSEGVLPLPKQPGFFAGMNYIETNPLPIVQCSANEVTLSLLEAR